MRKTRLPWLLVATGMLILPICSWADDKPQHAVELESQPLSEALKALADQTGLQVVFFSEVTDGVQTVALNGEYTADAALDTLLDDSGLTYEFINDNAVTIHAANGAAAEDSGLGKSQPASTQTLMAQNQTPATQTQTRPAATSTNENARTSSAGLVLEEILVTASKREQRIQDTAMSITALGRDEIERRGLINATDYLNTVPGVNMQDFGPIENKIVIRGLATGQLEESTVASYFGEVPINTLRFGNATDIKLIDIERVEVLRGPQGTLYGASSLGGTVRSIPVAPNLQDFEGKVEVGYSNTSGGGDNHKIEGVLNVPLVEDVLAVRLAGYRHDNSGYVDYVGANDPATLALAAASGASVVNREDMGDTENIGARLSLLWTPTEQLDVTLLVLTQDLEQEGWIESHTAFDAYQNNPLDITPLDSRGEFKADNIDIYNAVLEYDFGSLQLLSSTSYYEGLNDRAFSFNRAGPIAAGFLMMFDRDGFIQELRLTSDLDGALQFVGGLYYEDQNSTWETNAEWVGDDALYFGPDPNNVWTTDDKIAVEQKAVFGELSYAFTDQLSLTLGGRWFDFERRDTTARSGFFNGNVFTATDQTSDETGTSLKANLSYAINDDTLLYAQFAQGFRLGRPVSPVPAALCDTDNDGFLDGTNIPITTDSVDSDELDSFELGAKFTLLDGRLGINASVYRIDWTGIPIRRGAVPGCGFGLEINAGEAKSEGVEIEGSILLSESFLLNVGASYVDAELAEDSANLGPKGTRLPGSARLNAHLGLEFDFDVAGNAAFLRTDYAYIGRFRDDVGATFIEVGDYGVLNVHAGIAFERLDVTVFANNLTDADDYTAAQAPPPTSYMFRLHPRVVGLNVGYRF